MKNHSIVYFSALGHVFWMILGWGAKGQKRIEGKREEGTVEVPLGFK